MEKQIKTQGTASGDWWSSPCPIKNAFFSFFPAFLHCQKSKIPVSNYILYFFFILIIHLLCLFLQNSQFRPVKNLA